MRRRKLERGRPRMPRPPNRIRQRASNPRACQKVICGHLNKAGSSQFHSWSTISPPMKTKSSIPAIAAGAIQINLFHLGLMFSPSCLCKFVVNVAQSVPQIKHRVAFAGEQSVDAYATFRRQLFKTATLYFVSQKHFPLVAGQLFEGKLQLIEKRLAKVERFRAGIG